MRLGLACLAGSAAVIAGAWAWLGAPGADAAIPARKPAKSSIACPIRRSAGGQTPLDPSTQISAAQIEDDLTRLAKITDCVRTYSIDFGHDQIAGIAARHGLKVMQGLWLSSHADKNRVQIETAVALANRYPDTIRAVVVGNEVLLRGEMSAGGSRRHHARGEGAGESAGHLCRRLGVLAAQPRGRRGRRLHHHPYPALLGGFSDCRAQRRRPCRIRSAAAWWTPFPARK